MKRFALYLFSLAFVFVAHATTEWTLQGKSYNVDTINHIVAGPGTTLTSLRLTGAQNLNIFYTTTDLTNPLVEMRTVKSKDVIYAREKVSDMALRNDNDKEQYFLGVNADFYNMRRGNSIGSHIAHDEIYYLDDNGRTQWAIGNNRKPIMGKMDISCTVIANDKAIKLIGVNKVAKGHGLNLYTAKYGKTTDKIDKIVEVALVPVESPIGVGKKVKLKVSSAVKKGGEQEIPSNGYVLSGIGAERKFIKSLKENDIIEITTTVSLANGTNITPSEVISGYPVILRNGKVTDPVDILKHLNGLHPRTAIGNDSTGTKLTILIVDGRSKVSDGCTSKVLADIMRYVGCDDAMNLDGGGSSELYVKSLGICNVPSDGVERTVANGIFAVANVPVDNEIASIRFADYKKTINKNDTYAPVFYGYNKYGILIDTNVKGVKLSCPKKLGKIVQKGSTLQAKGAGTHLLTAKLGNLTTDINVTVKE